MPSEALLGAGRAEDTRGHVSLSAAELSALLDGLSVARLVVDVASGVARAEGVVPAWLSALDLATPLHAHVVPSDRARFAEVLARAAAQPQALEVGVLVGERTVMVNGTALGGAPGQVVLALQDVSLARHDARQWREVESWLVMLGESLPFDFWIQDRAGRYLLQNPASLKRQGVAIGKHTSELDAPSEAREALERGFEQAQRGVPFKAEVVAEVDGKPVTFARTMSPLTKRGEAVGVLGVDIDITPLKESEAALRRSLDQLSATQASLVRKKQLVAVGEMAAVVAHEVRNPLGSIANVVALLQRGVVSRAEEQELWRVIADETQRLDVLVVNLLDFVRPVTLRLTPQPLEPLVSRALQQTLWAEGARERVRSVVNGSVPPVPLDQTQLELAFTNLFRNAVQAMKGEGALEVHLQTEARDGRTWARVDIRDFGPGMAPEVRERLFEPFVTTRARGHGLGLAIVQKVVEQHRGEVWFEAASGGGTTCVVRLPLAAEP